MNTQEQEMVNKVLAVGSLFVTLTLFVWPATVLEAAGTPSSTATRLESVSLDLGSESVTIVIRADGAIRDYKSFSLHNPARIVFDLFGLKSTHEDLQALTPRSKQVRTIRYYGHPDKVRLVLDTNPYYLSSYRAESRPDGLAITVGRPEPRPRARGRKLERIPAAPAADAASAVAVLPKRKETPAPSAMPVNRQGPAPRLQASRIDEEGLKLDGNLDEPAWKRAPVAGGFVQLQPDEGAPATEPTEVRVLYGEKALYVGFRAFDADPGAIQAQLTRRDQWSYSDWVYVSIDSYNDKRTGFQFSVNPKGVKRDAYLFDDTHMDRDWDAVWEVETAVDDQGWTAEFRIPYSQLRFPHIAEQTWGIQFTRGLARKDELSYWSPISANEYANVSKFGQLWGMNGVDPPRRLEIMPYTMAKLQRAPGDTSNPLFEANDTYGTLGLDAKYGVTGDLTLDVTVNPDFGQVEADPAQVNLTAFETFFSERRPFFIEGANIFDFVLGYGPTGRPDEKLFYSRRIGRAPQGVVNLCRYYGEDPEPCDRYPRYMETPDATTIQTAEKISGKTASDWTVGLLHAATDEEEAHIISDTGEDISQVVEPTTQYSLVRLQRDFRDGHSALGAIATGVFRHTDDADALGLHREAITGGVDFRHRFWDNHYQISGYVLGSHVSGSEETISRTQQASARYMQRPDADHVTYDPTRTSLDGMSASLSFGRMGGGSWNYGLVARSRTPEFTVNDMGFARRSDMLMTSAWLGYFQFRPGKHFRRWSTNWNISHIQNHNNERTGLGTAIGTSLHFHNFWNTMVGVNYSAGALSTSMLRGGPAFKTDDRISTWVGIGSDSRKAVQVQVNANLSNQWESDSWSYSASSSLFWRPAGRVQMSVGLSYSKNETDSQWVDRWWKEWWAVTGDLPYIFGRISQETVSMTGRLDVAFTPNLTFQLYLQPFVAAGNYSAFKQVIDPRADRYADRFFPLESAADADCYGGYSAGVAGSTDEVCIANSDFNYKQFRSNAVLRWEFRPGSAVFVVWSQGRQHSDQMGEINYGSDFGTLFGSASDDVFLVKVSYWF